MLDGVCEDLVVSADGFRAAFVRSSATEPAELWILEPASATARRVHATTVRVPRAEAEVFLGEVDRLREDVDRAAARVEALLARFEKPSNEGDRA